MINYAEGIETAISKELEQENNYLIKKIYPLSPGKVPVKKQNANQILKEEFHYVTGPCQHSLKAIYGLLSMILSNRSR